MLTFSNEQQHFVLGRRRAFNTAQESMTAAHGDALRGNAAIGNATTLPRDVWGQWDREAVELQRSTLAVFNDLAATLSTPMPIGKSVHYFQTVSDSGSVNISMDGRSTAKTDQPVMEYHGTPLPILDSTFSYGWRQIEAARTEGFQLDAAGRTNSNRRIAEKLEGIVLDGDETISVGGAKLYGMRNHPKRSTRTTGVTLNGATGPQWLAEVTAALKLLHNKNFKVPATLYVNFDDWFYASNTDFSSAYPNKTIAQRVREIEGLQGIVVSDSIAANEMIALVKSREVLQVLNGMPLTTLPMFRANPHDDYNFMTMAAAALEVKFDAADQCGLAHSAAA